MLLKLLLLFALGGWSFVMALLDGLVAFFTTFGTQLFQHIIEEWLTSPYTITGFIMAILSGFGIWLGVKGGRRIHMVVSLICEIVGLVLLFSK